MFTHDPRFNTSLTPENFTLLHQTTPPARFEGGAIMTGAVRLRRDACPCATCRERRAEPPKPQLLQVLAPEEVAPLSIAEAA